MNGTGNLSAKFVNYLADDYRIKIDGDGFTHLSSLPGNLTDSQYATQAANRTNPSRPYVDVPVNVLQLGEVTHLIQRRGREIIREAGRENLRYQFGIAPLVGDLIKLCNFQDQVERRIQILEKLRGPRGYRRTIPLGKVASLEATDSSTATVQSSDLLIQNVGWTRVTRQLVGAHVRWEPSVSLMHLSPGGMRKVARRAVLGLTVDASTLWEVLPWSWLIDWGTTIGDYLMANRNIVGANLRLVNIMRHTRTVRTYQSKSGSSSGIPWTLTSFGATRETKSRVTASIAPTAHWPFLSANQVGILASLAVTRM